MTAKGKAVQATVELPDDASVGDAMGRLLFLTKMQRRLRRADTGQTVSHAEVKGRVAEWLT